MKTHRPVTGGGRTSAGGPGAGPAELQARGNAARAEEIEGGVRGGPGWIMGPEQREGFLTDPDQDPEAIDEGVDWRDFSEGEGASGVPFLRGTSPDGRRDDVEVEADDVIQHGIADCYVMSLAASVAGVNPDYVQEMIEIEGDGRYRVRFYEKDDSGAFHPVWVSVDGDLPYDAAADAPLYGQSPDVVGGVRETWPSLLEKAYAKFEEGMRVRKNLSTGREEVLGGYGAVNYGSPTAAYEAVMGQLATSAALDGQDDLAVMAERVASGRPVTAGVRGKKHLVAVVAVDAERREVTVLNQAAPIDHPERRQTHPYDEFLQLYNGLVY